MEFKRLVLAFGEWVEREPRGLFERISGRQAAAERDARLDELVRRVDRLQAMVLELERIETEMLGPLPEPVPPPVPDPSPDPNP